MLERVKAKLEGSKEPLVPISLRIEASTKTGFSVLATSYGVKSNELIRYVLQAFIEEAKDETLNYENLNPDHNKPSEDELKACENYGEYKPTTLGDILNLYYPERNGGKIISKGFSVSIIDTDLGDAK